MGRMEHVTHLGKTQTSAAASATISSTTPKIVKAVPGLCNTARPEMGISQLAQMPSLWPVIFTTCRPLATSCPVFLLMKSACIWLIALPFLTTLACTSITSPIGIGAKKSQLIERDTCTEATG